MAEVQTHSNAWEALYLHRPNFHSDLDWVWVEDGAIIGILGGHRIDTNPHWSVEILATHPQKRGRNLGLSMIREVQTRIETLPMLFWTRCTKARAFYLKHGFPEVQSGKLQKISQHGGQEIRFVTSSSEGEAVWCYGLPADRSN